MKNALPAASRRRRRQNRCLATVCASMLLITGCATVDTTRSMSSAKDPYRQARVDNLNRHVSTAFNDTPEVIPDRSGSGVEVSQKFFESSDTVVIASGDVADQVRAASVAVVSHAPMLTMTDSTRAEVIAEIERLGARYVLEVGNVPLASGVGDQIRIKDPGGIAALGELTALQFYPKAITYPTAVIQAVAALNPDEVSYLVPGWDEETYRAAVDTPLRRDTSRAKLPPFPAQSKRDADMAPLVIASEQSSVAAVATARAYGATVRSMRYPDPRFSRDSMKMVAGLSDQPLIALGSHFGTAEQLSEKIRLGEKVTTEIGGSGGGGIVFPGRTVVAVNADNVPQGIVDDEQDSLTQLVRHAKTQQANVARLLDGRFAHAAIVDFGTVDPDNDDPSLDEKEAELAAIVESGGLGIISVTPVAGRLKDQLRALESLLVNPGVSVMVDLSKAAALGTGISEAPLEEADDTSRQSDEKVPEFALADPRVSSDDFAGSARSDEGTTPHDLDGNEYAHTGLNPDSTSGDDDVSKPDSQRLSGADVVRGPVVLRAREINQASGYLSTLIKDKGLPQKAFILAQNAPGMVAERDNLATTSPHLAFTVLAQPYQWEEGNGVQLPWEQAKLIFGRTVDDYRFLGKELFYGWGTADLDGEGNPLDGRESALRIAEFNKLSPRPWLIIND